MNPLTQLKKATALFLVAFGLACFGLSLTAQAVSPAPDGGYGPPAYGAGNTAEGQNALFSLTTGTANTANGYQALYHNTTGQENTASGLEALHSNTTINGVSGNNNTATGAGALLDNTTGSNNTASGRVALKNNTDGSANTADGAQALYNNTTGHNNVALGYNAGYNLTTGSGNVCIGAGVSAFAGDSNITRIKNVYSSVASGRIVYVNSDNKLGTLASSRRFKEEIKPMDKTSEAILALKPVTFRYKKEIEPNGAIMFGLIAEEVEKVAPNLVTRNDKGEVETVRYDAVNAMLLNEFLKEHRKVQELEARLAQQEKDFTARLNEQDAKIQQVSDKMEVSKPAPQTVENDQ